MTTQISAEKVKRDNSNLYRFDKSLCRALRKERFKKPKHDVYLNYCLAADISSVNPYSIFEISMDIDVFRKSLKGLELLCFEYYMLGMLQIEIASMIGKNRSRVSQIMKNVLIKFKHFYEDTTC